LSSFLEEFASIIAIGLIATYMSVGSMICYSYVWFVIDAVFIYSSALSSSLYKHVNNAIATETEDGCFKAGIYIRVCIIINLIISIPLSVGVVYFMEAIMSFYGYDGAIMEYTIIAVVHNFLSTTSGFITITTAIDGYANFNAKFAFFDSIADIALSAYVIPYYKPTLVQFGLIFFASDMLSTAIYYYLTWYRWGWYDNYKVGMRSSVTMKNVSAPQSRNYVFQRCQHDYEND